MESFVSQFYFTSDKLKKKGIDLEYVIEGIAMYVVLHIKFIQSYVGMYLW